MYRFGSVQVWIRCGDVFNDHFITKFKFTAKSGGERNLKIGQSFPKLWTAVSVHLLTRPLGKSCYCRLRIDAQCLKTIFKSNFEQ